MKNRNKPYNHKQLQEQNATCNTYKLNPSWNLIMFVKKQDEKEELEKEEYEEEGDHLTCLIW